MNKFIELLDLIFNTSVKSKTEEKIVEKKNKKPVGVIEKTEIIKYKYIKEMHLTPNKYSRPQKNIIIKSIVIHWVANKLSTATANRNFFENRKHGNNGYGSAHEIIDLNGDIILCIPKNEMAYNCGSKTYTQFALDKLGTYPNNATYSIEITHIDWDGNMTEDTYNSLVQRLADLCIEFKLDPLEDIIRHYDVVGWKDCPRYFVNNPDEFKILKENVFNKIYKEI